MCVCVKVCVPSFVSMSKGMPAFRLSMSLHFVTYMNNNYAAAEKHDCV